MTSHMIKVFSRYTVIIKRYKAVSMRCDRKYSILTATDDDRLISSLLRVLGSNVHTLLRTVPERYTKAAFDRLLWRHEI